jgi:general secretion pathway protein N
MPGPRPVLLLSLLGFVLGLIVGMPLRWALPLLPKSLRCETPSGSLWSGTCTTLSFGALNLGTVQWMLKPASLLLGRVGAEVRVTQPGLTGSASLAVGFGGRVTAQGIDARISLGSPLLVRFAASLRGDLTLDLDELQLEDGWVRALRGTVDAADLEQVSPQPLALGRYRMQFDSAPDSAGRIVGKLSDQGGPLDVEGTLTLTTSPGYELQGTVLARPGAPPTLEQQIRFLGSPDGAGRRPFAQAETF